MLNKEIIVKPSCEVCRTPSKTKIILTIHKNLFVTSLGESKILNKESIVKPCCEVCRTPLTPSSCY